MTVCEAYRWLNRGFYAHKKAEALNALVQQCRERATGLVRASEGNDKGKSSTSKNGTENALMQLAEMQRQAEQMKAETIKVSAEIWQAIKLLHDDDLETVLINRYILFYTIDKTAEEMNYDPRTVRRKQRKAVEKLVLECPTLDMVL